MHKPNYKIGERYYVVDEESGIIYNTVFIIDKHRIWSSKSMGYFILDPEGCWWSYLQDHMSVYVRID